MSCILHIVPTDATESNIRYMDMQGLRKSTNDGAGATQLEACIEEDAMYETLTDGSTSGTSNLTEDNPDYLCLRSSGYGYCNVPIHQNETSFNESEKSLGNTRGCQTVPAKDILETQCKNKDVEPLVFCCSPLMTTRPCQIATSLLVVVISFLTGIGVSYGIWMASRNAGIEVVRGSTIITETVSIVAGVTESVGRSQTTTVQGFHESTGRASTMVTKSGEYVEIATDSRLFLTNDSNSAHKFLPVVPCLSNAVDIGCVSFGSAERSGWYVRHWNGDLWLESSVNPSNRDTFNVDGSFHIRRDKFCPGYFSFESVNFPNRFIFKDRNTTRGLYIYSGVAADYDRSCFNFIEK
jgi:hypothetical protein